MALMDRLVVGLLPAVPKPLVRHFSRPYIAGPTIEDAIRVVRSLNADGALATLDVLGEHIYREQEADRAMDAYLDLLDVVETERLDSNISIKLTQLGMRLDIERCVGRIERIVRRAKDLGDRFVRLDMEDSSCTDDTLEIYRRLTARGHSNVGVVIQSMLRRSASDVERLAAAKANVRLCKGIYVEPREIAYRDREIIRSSFTELLEILIEGGSYIGIATHDELLVFQALRLIRKSRLDRNRYEFQMLLGVDEELRRIILRAGHRLRVYVPFGEQWYAYSVRRLKENPQLAGTVARSALGLK